MRFERPNAFSYAFFYALSTRYQRVISRYFALSTPVFEFPGIARFFEKKIQFIFIVLLNLLIDAKNVLIKKV